MATPLPDNNPATVGPIEIILFRYNSVIITEDAQLGISPIIPVIKEVNILLFNNMFDNFSSPI
jgi:hypothetical protein